MDTMGSVLFHTEQNAAAEKLYHEEIAIEMAGDAKLRSLRMNAFYGLALVLGDEARYQEAADAGRDALAAARESLPPDHPWLLNIETAYANTLATMHQSAAAETLFRQVIDSQTRQMGPEHKHTLLTKLALVSDLLDQGRNEEAAAMVQPVAHSLESLLGADNIYTLSAWNQFGLAACNSHREEEGMAALKRVAEARQRSYPPGSWVIYSTQANIGLCELRARQYAQAETTLLAAVAGLESVRGAKFNRTQDGYRSLRELYTQEGKTDEAARWNAKISP
jgi:tetratricopeptide (TPR) repeat protein